MKISFTLNGRPVTEDVPADQTIHNLVTFHIFFSRFDRR